MNGIVLGKELFALIQRQLCLAKGHLQVIKKGRWRSNTPLIGSCFRHLWFNLRKSFFFQQGQFLTKRPIPGRFIFPKQALVGYWNTEISEWTIPANNESSRLNRQPHTIWGTKINYVLQIPRHVTYETESVSFIAPKIWSIVPQELRNYQSLYSFKKSLGKWKQNCSCRLCKIY